MYRAIIIDDESFSRQQLRLGLEDQALPIDIVAEANNGVEGLRQIEIHQPDLVFLNIEMPEMNGFEMLQKIKNPTFYIIFITSFDKYAIKAIRFSALGYLLKPIEQDELCAALQRFEQKSMMNFEQTKKYNNLLQSIKEQSFKVTINTNEGTLYFDTDDILFLEGQSNYTKFYFINKKTLLTSQNLKNYENILDDYGFIRIHKSLIVNKIHIEKIKNNNIFLKNHIQPLVIAKRRKIEILEKLKT